MPKNPTPKQRVKWHIDHAKVRACREMPASIRALIKAAKQQLTGRFTLDDSAGPVRIVEIAG